MKFGYTIAYVSDVKATLDFYKKAFGIETRFVHESGYGELATGETTLAFASHQMGKKNLPDGYVSADSSPRPLGMEIALVTDDVDSAYARAISAGARSVSRPAQKPWGQTVAYVRCPEGVLLELCTPVAS